MEKTIREMAEERGLKPSTVYYRIYKGWSKEKALNTPLLKNKKPTSKKRTYGAWCAMKDRCLCPTSRSYHRYGGRGVTICERWKNSFRNFFEDMGDPPKGYHLHRINNDGNYSKDNCAWIEKSEHSALHAKMRMDLETEVIKYKKLINLILPPLN